MKNDVSNSATAVKDPVCGMNVNRATARHHVEHAGQSYYFCCAQCAEKFKAGPEKYLSASAPPHSSNLVIPQAAHSTQPPAAVSSEHHAAYVCPMCPQVRESTPGPCPRCGMALE